MGRIPLSDLESLRGRDRPARPLHGRNNQIKHIETAFQNAADARQRKILLLAGAPGSGKTRLLAEAIDIAIINGFSVINGTLGFPGSENRPALSLLLTQLSRPGISENGFRAMAVTSPGKEVRTWLLGVLKCGPVLVALDDLHLVDASTLLALCDLITDLSTYPIVWIMAFRSERDSISYGPMETHLTRLRAERIPELGPLSSDAVTQLVADCLGAIPDPTIVALAEGVGGMPGAVIELVHGLAQDGDLRVGDGTAHLKLSCSAGMSMTAGALDVPRRFAAMIHRSLQSLSPFTKKALKLAAVLGTSFAPKDLSKMLDESPGSLLTVLDEALACGLVVCRSDDFAFRSEPVWRVVLDSVPLPVRVLLHRQAATMLLSEPDGMEAAALHLVHSAQHGDAEAVRIISQAAKHLLTSDPLTAASLATRGRELLDPEQPEWVLLASAAVEAFIRAGRVDRAIGLAEDTIKEIIELERQTSDAHAEAVASLQAWISVALLFKGKAHQAVRAAHNALAVSEGESKHYEQAEISRLLSYCLTDDSAAVRRADEILGASEDHPRAVKACALTVRALDQWRAGRLDRATSILHDAIELNSATTGVQLLDPRWILASMYTKLGELEEAIAVIRASSRAVGEASGTKSSAAVPTILRASVHLMEGRLDDADEDAKASIAAMTDGCMPLLAPQAWGVLTLVALRRGDLAQAKEHLHALEERFPRDSSRPWWAMRFLLNAQLAEAKSGPRAAMEILENALATAGARRELILEDPTAAAWCVRSALAVDMRDVAGLVVDTAEILRTHNRNLLAVCAGAMHAHALLLQDIDALAQVTQFHREPWARASTFEDRAVQLLARGDRETAISDLEQAMSGYTTLGSERDAARVRRRLRRLGIRRRHWAHVTRPVSGWDSLTKTERKVAEQVASGLTNRQVASQMFVSPHTVGFHLRQIYRKLEIRSRIDLIRYKS
jgi:DNA-binding CsgD family transcriptional regulator/tetratricopeptide (TPR) repeat protein